MEDCACGEPIEGVCYCHQKVKVLPGPFRKKARVGYLIPDSDPNSHLMMGRGARIRWADTLEEDYLGSMEIWEWE